MKQILKTLFFLLLLALGGCKYNYIVVMPQKAENKPLNKIETNHSYPVPNQWNYIDIKRLTRISDSISNIINNQYRYEYSN